jgi:hypothetical protein
MDLVEVDVLHVQPGQRGIDGRQDVLAGEAAPVLARRHRHEHLGGNDRLVTGQELGDQTPGGDLAAAGRVRVGGVEEGHTPFGRSADDRLGVILADHPGTVAVVPEPHHAQAHPGDSQAGLAKVHVFHLAPSLGQVRPAVGSPARLEEDPTGTADLCAAWLPSAMRRRGWRTFHVEADPVDETPPPVLPRLIGPDERMSGRVEVPRRVTPGRVVAAADMGAFEAEPQVDPTTARRQALLTPVRRSGRRSRVNVRREMGADVRHWIETYLRPVATTSLPLHGYSSGGVRVTFHPAPRERAERFDREAVCQCKVEGGAHEQPSDPFAFQLGRNASMDED